MAVAAAVVAALVVVGAVDYALTSAEVAEIDARSEGFGRSYLLGDDLDVRCWIYATVALGAMLAATAIAWRRSAPGARRDLFTDLGVAGVVLLLLAFFTLFAAGGRLSPPRQPLAMLGTVALVLAAVGTLATRPTDRRQGAPAAGAPQRPAVTAALAYAPWLGLGLTAIAAILCGFVLAENWDPCVDEQPGEIAPLTAATGVAAVGAAICGLACLFRRRWVVALALLATGPVVWALAAASTACWN
jgi:hypothetical protein